MSEDKFCTKCGAPIMPVTLSVPTDRDSGRKGTCARLLKYWQLHPTLPSVSHAILPAEDRVKIKTGAKVEVPPSPRLCTACEKPNLGWCPHCKRSFCAKQECMLQHESVCPGFRAVMRPSPKSGQGVNNLVPKRKSIPKRIRLKGK